MKTKKRLRQGPIVLRACLFVALFGPAANALASPPDHAVPIPVNEVAFVAPPLDAPSLANAENANYNNNPAFNYGVALQTEASLANNVFNNSAGANIATVNSSPNNNVTANYTHIANYANLDKANNAKITAPANVITATTEPDVGTQTVSSLTINVNRALDPNPEGGICFGTALANGIGVPS